MSLAVASQLRMLGRGVPARRERHRDADQQQAGQLLEPGRVALDPAQQGAQHDSRARPARSAAANGQAEVGVQGGVEQARTSKTSTETRAGVVGTLHEQLGDRGRAPTPASRARTRRAGPAVVASGRPHREHQPAAAEQRQARRRPSTARCRTPCRSAAVDRGRGGERRASAPLPTTKRIAPATGCESAEMTRKLAVYVPSPSPRLSVHADLGGVAARMRRSVPVSTRRPVWSMTRR